MTMDSPALIFRTPEPGTTARAATAAELRRIADQVEAGNLPAAAVVIMGDAGHGDLVQVISTSPDMGTMEVIGTLTVANHIMLNAIMPNGNEG